MFKKYSILTLCALVPMFFYGCKPAGPALYRNTQVLMGTFVEVVSYDRRAAGIVFAEIRRIEGLTSKYKKDSDISLLNKLGRLRVHADVFYLLNRAKEFWMATDGAFDVSVGPLMDIWGFTNKHYHMPSYQQIHWALSLVGTNKIIFHPVNNMIELSVLGMEIDLGAIAKGYAVDSAVNALKRSGITSCLINAGGEIYALGTKDGRPWKIAIKSPRSKSVVDYIELQDKAVATSGDYEQFFIKNKRRFSHIMNPKTGYPENSGVISATVVASDCLTADFLATSIVVMGKQRGEKLLLRFPGTSVKIIEHK